MELSYMELRERICDTCHKMWQLGWMVANDGSVSAGLGDGIFLVTPTGMSKSFITPEKSARIDGKDEMLKSLPGYRPFSEVRMHSRCYKEREDVNSVLYAHSPVTTGHTVVNVPLDEHSMIETVIALGPIPVMPYGIPPTYEVSDNIAPYLGEHDAILLQSHGVLTVRANVITTYYRVETLEFFAKVSLNARMLGGVQEISREDTDRPVPMRKGYGVIDRCPNYKKYSKQGKNRC